MQVRPWHEIIDEAEQRGAFSEVDSFAASAWATCACGHQDPRIPRFTESDAMEAGPCIDSEGRFVQENAPIDVELNHLGSDFADAVCESDFMAAREIMDKIEDRARIVLQEAIQQKARELLGDYDAAVKAWEAAGSPAVKPYDPWSESPYEEVAHSTEEALCKAWRLLCEYCTDNGLDPREIK